GASVAELAQALIDNDLEEAPVLRERRRLAFASSLPGDPEAGDVTLSPYGACVLICGPSASGKSSVAKRIVQALRDCGYEFCLVAPEGDCEGVESAVVIGSAAAPPPLEEVVQLLEKLGANGVVSLTGTPISDRPRLFVDLFAELLQLRARYGRPHWLVVDEVH